MPELPEVETIRRIVERALVGLPLTDVHLSLPKLLRDSPISEPGILVGRSILRAERRAKILITHWSGELSALTHFKLAGQFAVVTPNGNRFVAGHPVPDPEGPLPHKSTHLSFSFANGTAAYYSDLRQFGWWRLMPTSDIAAALDAFAFGPEGIDGEALTVESLANRLARRRVAIKTVLLDQRVVAGLGNIYVDEALYRARIHPARPANGLTAPETAALHEAVGWSLQRGIEQGGADIRRGKAFPRDGFPAVHARRAAPCARCGTVIVKVQLNGRGTYFCPACQAEPEL